MIEHRHLPDFLHFCKDRITVEKITDNKFKISCQSEFTECCGCNPRVITNFNPKKLSILKK